MAASAYLPQPGAAASGWLAALIASLSALEAQLSTQVDIAGLLLLDDQPVTF
jgi:hypothetical protein